jgi:hypothetical protein
VNVPTIGLSSDELIVVVVSFVPELVEQLELVVTEVLVLLTLVLVAPGSGLVTATYAVPASMKATKAANRTVFGTKVRRR